MTKMALALHQKLRDLCCKRGWCYATIWKLPPSNPITLTWGDGDQASTKSLSDSKIASIEVSEIGTTPSQENGNPLQGHIIGDDATRLEVHIKLPQSKMSSSLLESLIADVALTGKHRWIHIQERACTSADETAENAANIEQIPNIWSQSHAGIKTIALIAVLEGVIELGSSQKMIEDIRFVSHILALFNPPQSAPTTSPLHLSRKTLALRSPTGRAVPVSRPMPFCRGAFLVLNGPLKHGISSKGSCNNGQFGDGFNSAMSKLSNQRAISNLPLSGCNSTHGPGTKVLHARVEGSPEGPRGHMEKSSRLDLGGKESAWILTSTWSEGVEYAKPAEELVGSSCSTEAEPLHRFKTMLEPSCFHLHRKGSSLSGDDVTNLSNVEEYSQFRQNMPGGLDTRGFSSNSDGIVTSRSVLSVNSRSRDDVSTIIVDQPDFTALQSANNHHESLEEYRIRSVGDQSFRGADVKQLIEGSPIQVKHDTFCPSTLPPTMSSRKRSGCGKKPTDRQLLRDRLRKLRKIVPDSTRCSIHELLERTIKHMQYLQRVTQYE